MPAQPDASSKARLTRGCAIGWKPGLRETRFQGCSPATLQVRLRCGLSASREAPARA